MLKPLPITPVLGLYIFISATVCSPKVDILFIPATKMLPFCKGTLEVF